jgi:hypothetical protein
MAKKMTQKEANKKYADGTSYKTPSGETRKRVSAPNTPRADAYCARSAGQKQTMKVKARRDAWGC